jgi:hypothetical protein
MYIIGTPMRVRISWFLILEVIGIALLVSFYAAVLILPFWPSSPIPPIYTLNVHNPNWKVANSNTTATLVNEGLQIESVSKSGEYELLTDPIAGVPGKVYTVSYHLKLQAGKTIIGVYDNVSNQWISSKAVDQARDEVQFLSPRNGNSFQIVLQNGSPSFNMAILVELTVSEPR